MYILNDYLSIQETEENKGESKDKTKIIMVESEFTLRLF